MPNLPKNDQYPPDWVEASIANSGAGIWLPGGMFKSATPTRRELRRQQQQMQNVAQSFGKYFTTNTNTTGNPGNGLPKPLSAVSFQALRAMSYSSQIDMLIIGALKSAARRYGQICDVPGKQKGFRVVHRQHRDSDFDSDTPDIRKRCAEMEELLKHPTNPPHTTFMDFLMSSIEEQLVLDRRCLVLPKDRVGRIGSFHLIDGACYSDDTEVLTRSGWKKFTDVDMENDEFATRNQQTQEFEWQKSTYFHEQEWDGELLHFNSRSLDVLVTPNHRMLATHSDDVRHERIITAEKLGAMKSGNMKLPATSSWNGTYLERFKLKKTNVRGQGFDVDGNDFAAFMGMWLAEGSKGGEGNNSSTIVISQMEKSKGFVEYRALLTRILGQEPYYNGKVFSFKNKALRDYLTQFGVAHEKFIPEQIKGMSPDQLAIFWRFYMLGDGHFETTKAKNRRASVALGFKGRQRIATSSRKMADDLQEVAQKLGYSASVSLKGFRNSVVNGREINQENCQQQYVVNLRSSKYHRFSSVAVPYSGKVYCVSVPNEILYVRRNGKPLWCGNTIQPVIELLGPWMRENQVFNEDNARFKMQMDLWKNPPQDARTGAPVNVDLSEAAYVQVIEGRVVAAWKADEMYVGIANPSIAIDHAFYGRSPLESSIYLSILFSKVMRFNANLFDVSFPEGILALTGDIDEEGLEAFKRSALDFDPNDSGTRLPIITGDGEIKANLIQLRESPQDMRMVEMTRMLACWKCAAYRVHPSIINVTDEGQPLVGNSDDGAIEQAVGDGFHGLMVDQANLLTNAIVSKRYDDLIVIVEGLDDESEEQALNRLQIEKSFKTLNEVRVSRSLKELPEELPTNMGDFVADSGYLQIYQLLSQQAQQAQQQDMGQYEQGDFGQGADDQGQPWSPGQGQDPAAAQQAQPGQAPNQTPPGAPANQADAQGQDQAQAIGQQAGNPGAGKGTPQAIQKSDTEEESVTIRISGSSRALSGLLSDEADDDRVF